MKSKLTKIIILALSCLLLIGAAIGIAVSAEETPTVAIKAKNLAYEGAIQVLYAVDANNVPADAKVQMYFYDTKDATEPFVKDAYDKPITIGGVEYLAFFSRGIAPKNMRATIYAKAVIVSANEIIAESELSEYSVYTYAINRFSKNPTEDQSLLYAAMLDYGAAVQDMLLKTGKLTEDDILDAGGWANAYCGIRQDTSLDGNNVATGKVNYYTLGEAIELYADNMYADGVFADITDADGKAITSGAYPKAEIVAAKPGITAYTANYNVTGYSFETFDDYLVDGSANDVNTLYKGKTGLTAQNAFGVCALNSTFGNALTDVRYQRIVKNEITGNNSYIVGANGGAKDNALAFSLNNYVESSDKYVIQFDLNWHGVKTDTADSATYIRIESQDINDDKSDIIIIQLVDSKVDDTTYTLLDVELNKNEIYTIRYEMTPKGPYAYDLDMYVNGQLKNTAKAATPINASVALKNVDCFLGVRFFNRVATDYSYELDNVYVACNAPESGEGKYANNENTYDFSKMTLDEAKGILHTESDIGGLSVNNGDLSFRSGFGGILSKLPEGDKHVFETDFYFEAGTATANSGNTGWLGFSAGSRSKSSMYVCYQMNYTASNGKLTSLSIQRYDCNEAGTTIEDKLFTMYPDTWYNVRLEYTPLNTVDESGNTVNRGFVELYVNGKFVSSYISLGYAGTKGANSNAKLNTFGFEIRSEDNSKTKNNIFHLKNTFIGAVDDNRGTGEYYNNNELAGTRYDGTSTDALTSASKFKVTSDCLSLTELASAAFGFKNTDPNGTETLPTGNVHVFETDIRFNGGKCTSPSQTLAWFGMIDQVISNDVKTNEFAPFMISPETNSYKDITAFLIHDHKDPVKLLARLEVGKWYNIRFVYTADNELDGEGNVTKYKGKVEMFVNNVSVANYETVGYIISSDADSEPNNVLEHMWFQFRGSSLTGMSYATLDFDNIYLGTFNK